LDDFVYWYNDVRFHESLDTKHYLQTPKDAFWSSLPVEAGSGVAFKLLMRWGMRGRFIKSKISGLHKLYSTFIKLSVNLTKSS